MLSNLGRCGKAFFRARRPGSRKGQKRTLGRRPATCRDLRRLGDLRRFGTAINYASLQIKTLPPTKFKPLETLRAS